MISGKRFGRNGKRPQEKTWSLVRREPISVSSIRGVLFIDIISAGSIPIIALFAINSGFQSCSGHVILGILDQETVS